MTIFIAGVFGKIVGIILVSKLFNFIFKKITKSETVKQRLISTALSTSLYIIIPTFVTRTGENIDELLGWIAVSFLGWLITVNFFVFKMKFSQCFISLLYGFCFWFLGSILISLIFKLFIPNLNDNILGTVILGLSFIISPLLVYKQKLPWTSKRFKW